MDEGPKLIPLQMEPPSQGPKPLVQTPWLKQTRAEPKGEDW